MSKITNDGLTRSGTGCSIAVPIWQQWASKWSVGQTVGETTPKVRTAMSKLQQIIAPRVKLHWSLKTNIRHVHTHQTLRLPLRWYIIR